MPFRIANGQTWSREQLENKLQRIANVSKKGTISSELETKEPSATKKFASRFLKGGLRKDERLDEAAEILQKLKPQVVKSNDCPLMELFNHAVCNFNIHAGIPQLKPIYPLRGNLATILAGEELLLFDLSLFLNTPPQIVMRSKSTKPEIDFEFPDHDPKLLKFLFSLLCRIPTIVLVLSIEEASTLLGYLDLFEIHDDYTKKEILETVAATSIPGVEITAKGNSLELSLDNSACWYDLEHLLSGRSYISSVDLAKNEANPKNHLWEFVVELDRLERVTTHFNRQCGGQTLVLDISRCQSAKEFKDGSFLHNLNETLKGAVEIRNGGHLACRELVAILKELPKGWLKRLELQGRASLTSGQLRSILENQPNLEYLDLSFCRELDAEGLMDIAKYCTKLKEIKLDGCSGKNLKVIYSILKANHQLEKASFKDWGVLSSNLARKPFLKHSKLNRLDLSGALAEKNSLTYPASVNDWALAMVIPSSLKHLSINNSNIGEGFIKKLAHLAPNIESLSCANCSRLNSYCFNILADACKQLESVTLSHKNSDIRGNVEAIQKGIPGIVINIV